MNKLITIFVCLVISIHIENVKAQITTVSSKQNKKFKTSAQLKAKMSAKAKKSFPYLDVKPLLEEDKLVKAMDIPYRFGKGFETAYTLKDGDWENTSDGKIWRLLVTSHGAYSLNFIFDELSLAKGAELYIYNEDGTIVYGPVTSDQNITTGETFLTDLVKGETVVLHLYEPKNKKSKLRISKVVHGYRDMFSDTNYSGLNDSESCNNDAICFPDWDQESDAIALVLLSNGEEWCSGSLLNNTAQNFRPFFLTAFHCIDSDHNDALSEEEISNAENWMFRFQYRKLSCESSILTNTVTFNRADFRAAWNNTDFALMEMENTPLGDARFTWLGWDRTGNTPSSGTGIHHPAGDVMKISFDDDELDTSSWGGPDNHWLVHFDDGVVQHGSSGSSLLDQNKRVIGQLHGNQSYNNSLSYCDQPRAEYGRLSISWDGGNTDASRLSNWLDPCGAGSQTTNTLQSVFMEGSDIVCSSGSTYNLNNLLSGTTVTWSSSSNISFPYGNTGGTVTAKAYSTSSGAGWIEATISGACGDVTLPRKDVWVGLPLFSLIGEPNPLFPRSLTTTVIDYSITEIPSGQGVNQVDWSYTGPIASIVGNMFKANYKTANYGGEGFVYALATNACGSKENRIYYEVEDFMYMSVFPNPVNEYAELNFYSGDELSTYQKDSKTMISVPTDKVTKEMGEYEIQIWNERKGLVKQMKSKSKKLQIPTNNLEEGIYFLHVIVNGQVYKQQLKVQR